MAVNADGSYTEVTQTGYFSRIGAGIVMLVAALCLAASGAVSSARADDWEQGGQSSPGFEQSPSGDFDAAPPQDTSESDRLRDENEQLRQELEELKRQAAEAKDEKERGQREALERQAAAAAQSPTGKTFTNSVGMEFVLIPAGTFMMGCEDEDSDDCETDEKPQHEVTISRPFYIGKYEVTNRNFGDIYRALTHSTSMTSTEQRCPDCPSTSSFENAQENIVKRLNKLEGHNRYRLPTEAEWEYAARAGTTTVYHFGDDKEQLKKYAWYKDNSKESVHVVGEKRPNPWGLHDMHGNVWEWTQDCYDKKYYQTSPAVDPRSEFPNCFRVIRGCGYLSADYENPGDCRSAVRGANDPRKSFKDLGVRLVLEVAE